MWTSCGQKRTYVHRTSGHPHDRTLHHRVPHHQSTGPPHHRAEREKRRDIKPKKNDPNDEKIRSCGAVGEGHHGGAGQSYSPTDTSSHTNTSSPTYHGTTGSRHHQEECTKRRDITPKKTAVNDEKTGACITKGDDTTPWVTARRASAPHGPSCLGSPRPVVHRLPTARRASAPHRSSCIGSPSPVMCNDLASRRPVVCHAPAQQRL